MSNGRISINIELEGFEEFADAMAKMPKVLLRLEIPENSRTAYMQAL